MKNLYLPLTPLLLLAACSSPSTNSLTQMESIVKHLAHDDMEGRLTGSEGGEKAAKYVATQLENLGLEKLDGSYFQEYTRNPKSNPHVMEKEGKSQLGMGTVKPLTSNNVVAQISGKTNQYVVIGAHYDHLGYGNESSLSQDSAIHNGADDNASGVAVMIELAERLQKQDLNQNYLFIAFSGEEQGLWGSNFFVKNSSIPSSSLDYMINMDMVGRMKEDKLAINGVGTTPGWMGLINKANSDSLKLVTTESGVGPSDHTSFYNEGIPVLHFFTGQHEDYHKSSDDEDKINYDGMELVLDLLYRLVLDLDDEPKLTFTKTVDQSPNDSPAFKVTLGVIPDYLFSESGMRIDGISENRPASKAGIEKGDIVIKMGEVEVIDMMSYMEGLNQYEPGDSSIVTVSRDSESLTFNVTFD